MTASRIAPVFLVLALVSCAAARPTVTTDACPRGYSSAPADLSLASLAGSYDIEVSATAGAKRGKAARGRLELALPGPRSPRPAVDSTSRPGYLILNAALDFDLVGTLDASLIHWLYDWVEPAPAVPFGKRSGVGLSFYPQVDPDTKQPWGAAYLHLDVRADGTDSLMTGHGPDVFDMDCVGPKGFTGTWSNGTYHARRQ